MPRVQKKTSRRTRKHAMPLNFKTELCKNWVRTGDCDHGDRCNFAHGEDELRKENLEEVTKRRGVKDASSLRSLLCQKYLMAGACPYNDRCIYRHDVRLGNQEAASACTRALRPCKSAHRAPSGDEQATSQAAQSNKDFYWPDLRALLPEESAREQFAPDARASYNLPNAFKSSDSMEERGMWSMWEHFLAFLGDRDIPDTPENPFLPGVARLPALQGLVASFEAADCGECTTSEDIQLAASVDELVKPSATLRALCSPTTVTQDLDLSDDEDDGDSSLWQRFSAKPARKTFSNMVVQKPIARPVARRADGHFAVRQAAEDCDALLDVSDSEAARLVGSLFSEVMLM